MILAAIDIGSNAARLLISQAEVYSDGTVDYTKLTLLRIPLRLGVDVFSKGYIGEEKVTQFMDSLRAYKLMMKIYKVQAFKACATSAMRDATNGPEILRRAKEETDFDIHIISGQEEADIIYETHIAEALSLNRSYLYIDVGGGSTEITLFSNNNIVFKESFNIGTIRLLQGKVTDEQWDAMKTYIKAGVKAHGPVEAIGTGGNINKVFSLSRRKEGKPLPIELLRDYYKELSVATVAERMHRYQLRADRADVIVPALQIYISIMRWAGAEEILVPRIGLAD
jgi:exopolyphosphatase/guanosine-5'-triphosphate,3'-diphosphate pyrophosphatase